MHYVGSGSLSMVHSAMFWSESELGRHLVLQIFYCREPNEIPLNISELEGEVRGCADNEQF